MNRINYLQDILNKTKESLKTKESSFYMQQPTTHSVSVFEETIVLKQVAGKLELILDELQMDNGPKAGRMLTEAANYWTRNYLSNLVSYSEADSIGKSSEVRIYTQIAKRMSQIFMEFASDELKAATKLLSLNTRF